jgi:hypothetical protein
MSPILEDEAPVSERGGRFWKRARRDGRTSVECMGPDAPGVDRTSTIRGGNRIHSRGDGSSDGERR